MMAYAGLWEGTACNAAGSSSAYRVVPPICNSTSHGPVTSGGNGSSASPLSASYAWNPQVSDASAASMTVSRRPAKASRVAPPRRVTADPVQPQLGLRRKAECGCKWESLACAKDACYQLMHTVYEKAMLSISFGRGVAAAGLALFAAAFSRPAVSQSVWARLQNWSKDLETGGWRGFAISMAADIAKTLGTKWQCAETTWGTIVLDLKFKKIDFTS